MPLLYLLTVTLAINCPRNSICLDSEAIYTAQGSVHEYLFSLRVVEENYSYYACVVTVTGPFNYAKVREGT